MYINSVRFLAVVVLFSSLTACSEGWSGTETTEQKEQPRPEMKALTTTQGAIKSISVDESGNIAVIGTSNKDIYIDRINANGNSLLGWPQKISPADSASSLEAHLVKTNGQFVVSTHKTIPANTSHLNVFLGSNASATIPQVNLNEKTSIGDIAMDQNGLYFSTINIDEPGTSIIHHSSFYAGNPTQVKITQVANLFEITTDGLYVCGSNTVSKLPLQLNSNVIWSKTWSSNSGSLLITSTALSGNTLYVAGLENEHPRLAAYALNGDLNWAVTFQIMKTDQPVFVATNVSGTPYLSFNSNLYKMNPADGMITDSLVVPNTKFVISGNTAFFFQKDKLSQIDLSLLR